MVVIRGVSVCGYTGMHNHHKFRVHAHIMVHAITLCTKILHAKKLGSNFFCALVHATYSCMHAICLTWLLLNFLSVYSVILK